MKNTLDKLNEDQIQFAQQIVEKAKAMGVPPRLAVALAFRESGLNPKALGEKGEVGLMQVMPATAKGMGFTPEELANPSKNIEIGLTYLKQNLDKFGGDPMLAAAGYNAGPNHPYFTDPDNNQLPESTKTYLKDINTIGGFAATQPTEEQATTEVKPPASESDFMANKARLAADAIGMGAGAALSKGLDVAKNVGDTAAAIRQIPGALAAAQAPTPSIAPAGAPMPRPVAGGPAGPVGGPASPLQQMGGPAAPGAMTRNYGTAAGLTEIEAGRALDNTKKAGGVHDLLSQRREAMNKIQSMGGGYVENPRFGGIMTPDQGGGGGPRATYVQNPTGGLSQLPPTQTIPNTPLPPQAPPQPGTLAKVGQGIKAGAGAVLRSPIATGALGGLSVAESANEAQKRMGAGDTTGAGIAGAGGLGGALMMMPNPYVKAIGAAISAASPLTQYLRDNLNNQPEAPEPTPEELLAAQQPAFRYARP